MSVLVGVCCTRLIAITNGQQIVRTSDSGGDHACGCDVGIVQHYPAIVWSKDVHKGLDGLHLSEGATCQPLPWRGKILEPDAVDIYEVHVEEWFISVRQTLHRGTGKTLA